MEKMWQHTPYKAEACFVEVVQDGTDWKDCNEAEFELVLEWGLPEDGTLSVGLLDHAGVGCGELMRVGNLRGGQTVAVFGLAWEVGPVQVGRGEGQEMHFLVRLRGCFV